MRRDFYIYNEADFFVLYAEGGKAPDRREIAEDLGRAASDGYAVPVELVQDDCFHIRFVDEELTEEEAVEWVGKVEWDLRIPGGALALTAGLGPDDEVDEEGTCRVDVPPGDYRVTVYSYFPGVNGSACLRAAGNTEALGEWFRRTRPAETMPDWLLCRLTEDPGNDPGHERAWEAFMMSEGFVEAQRGAQASPTIDFLVHLVPLAPGQACRNEGRKGPLPGTANARKPDLFPMGLVATVAAAAEGPDFVWQPRSPEAKGLLATVPPADALTDGSPVVLPIEALHQLARIPAWCDPMAWAILLIEPPASAPETALGIEPSFYIGLEEADGRWLISLKPKDKLSIGENMRAIEKALVSLAEGTVLECVWGDYTGMNSAGNQRYRGPLSKGGWAIEAAYPAMRGGVLREAVEFSGHLDRGCIHAKDSQEASAFLALFHKAMPDWAAVVQPRVDGTVLTLGMDDPGELWNAARLAFAMRYSGTWDAWAWWEEMYPGLDGGQLPFAPSNK